MLSEARPFRPISFYRRPGTGDAPGPGDVAQLASRAPAEALRVGGAVVDSSFGIRGSLRTPVKTHPCPRPLARMAACGDLENVRPGEDGRGLMNTRFPTDAAVAFKRRKRSVNSNLASFCGETPERCFGTERRIPRRAFPQRSAPVPPSNIPKPRRCPRAEKGHGLRYGMERRLVA